jgi:hypothetical protein
MRHTPTAISIPPLRVDSPIIVAPTAVDAAPIRKNTIFNTTSGTSPSITSTIRSTIASSMLICRFWFVNKTADARRADPIALIRAKPHPAGSVSR